MRYDRKAYLDLRRLLERKGISTICFEADCPNRYECFSEGTATFMILGNICTRDCTYCNVCHGMPADADMQPVLKAAEDLDLQYVVITSPTRDDLPDGGATEFAACIQALHSQGRKVEVLIPDLIGDALATVLDAEPDVLGHNLETVRHLFPVVRPEAEYRRSLGVLRSAARRCTTKSGLMVGLGESMEDVKNTLRDIKDTGCHIVTIGQYLPPSNRHAALRKEYSADEFREMERYARSLGFAGSRAGKLVRSSYHAAALQEGLGCD